MKKVLFMLVVVLIGTGCYAQKKNVSQAKNKAMAAENPDFTGARALIGEALEDETTKNLADTWYWAGMIGYKENEYLERENSELREENTILLERYKDHALLRKVFGDRKIDELVKSAEEIQRGKNRPYYKSHER